MLAHLLLLSRCATSGARGKLMGALPVRLADDTLDGLRKQAAAEGIPASEFARILIEARVHGPNHGAEQSAARIRRVLGDGYPTDDVH